MKIIIKRVNNAIREVCSLDYYKRRLKTENEVLLETPKFNERYRKQGIAYETVDVTGPMSEVMQFFLGENAYERAHTITELCDQLSEVKDSLEEIESDVCDRVYQLEVLCKKIRQLLTEDGE